MPYHTPEPIAAHYDLLQQKFHGRHTQTTIGRGVSGVQAAKASAMDPVLRRAEISVATDNM